MPIFEKTIRHGDVEYKVEFDFDDEAIMENSATFEINASFRPISANNDEDGWTEISIKGEVNWEKREFVLSYEGQVIGKMPLDLLVPESDPLGTTLDITQEDNILGPHFQETAKAINGIAKDHVSHAIEKGIHLLPTDPFLGCIIKGAASTAIGQIIRCWQKNREVRPYKALARRVGSCLRDHATGMLLTFMWRTGRCVLLAGLH
jgi:hypothetical protein